MRNGWIIAILALCLFILPSSAAPRRAGATAGDALLRGDVGARPTALGGAYTAAATGPLSLRYNPAGLYTATNHQLFLQHEASVLDIRREDINYARPWRNGGIGVSISYLDYGTIERTYNEAVAVNRGTAGANDLMLRLGFGRTVSPEVSLGVSLGWHRLELDDHAANGLSADFGLLWSPRRVEGLTIGAALRNVGTNARFIKDYENLPVMLQSGAMYKFNWLITGHLDVEVVRDRDPGLHAGLELTPLDMLTLRAGYNGRNDVDDGLTAGFGLRLRNFNVDYAYVPFGDLGEAHRLSAEVAFGEPVVRTQPERVIEIPSAATPIEEKPVKTAKSRRPVIVEPEPMIAASEEKMPASDVKAGNKRGIRSAKKETDPAVKAFELASLKKSAAAAVASGDLQQAIAIHLQILAEHPQENAVRYNLATLFYKANDFPLAAAQYREYLDAVPRDAEAWLYLGYAHHKAGNRDQARMAWKKALDIDPENRYAQAAARKK